MLSRSVIYPPPSEATINPAPSRRYMLGEDPPAKTSGSAVAMSLFALAMGVFLGRMIRFD